MTKFAVTKFFAGNPVSTSICPKTEALASINDNSEEKVTDFDVTKAHTFYGGEGRIHVFIVPVLEKPKVSGGGFIRPSKERNAYFASVQRPTHD